MKFKVNSKELKPVLDNLVKITKTRTTIPAYDYFKLELDDSELNLTASDGEITVIIPIVPEEIDVVGSVCVLADKLTDVVRNFKEDILSFELNGNIMVIKSKGGKFKIPTFNSEDFPLIVELKENKSNFSITSSGLLNGINKTLFATYGNDEFKPTLCGVCVDLDDDFVSMFATDTLEVAYFKTGVPSTSNGKIIFPNKLCSKLSNTLSQDDSFVDVFFDDKNILIETSSMTIRSRMIEGKYVDYKTMLPSSFEGEIVVNVEDLKDAIKRVFVFSDVINNTIHCSIEGELLKLTSEDKAFSLSAEESIECVSKMGNYTSIVNGRLLLEAIDKIDSERCTIQFNKLLMWMTPIDSDNSYNFGVVTFAF